MPSDSVKSSRASLGYLAACVPLVAAPSHVRCLHVRSLARSKYEDFFVVPPLPMARLTIHTCFTSSPNHCATCHLALAKLVTNNNVRHHGSVQCASNTMADHNKANTMNCGLQGGGWVGGRRWNRHGQVGGEARIGKARRRTCYQGALWRSHAVHEYTQQKPCKNSTM